MSKEDDYKPFPPIKGFVEAHATHEVVERKTINEELRRTQDMRVGDRHCPNCGWLMSGDPVNLRCVVCDEKKLKTNDGQLKPCPFCGNNSPEKTTWPYSPSNKLHSATVECCTAHSRATGRSRSIALREAIKNWNTLALPPLPTKPVGNVEAIHYLHLCPEGEVFAVPASGAPNWDGGKGITVKFMGLAYRYLPGENRFMGGKFPVLAPEYTLVPRSEAPEKVIAAFEKLKVGFDS